MRQRIVEEIALLRHHYGGDVEYVEPGDWFLIPRYPVPARCNKRMCPVAFNLRAGYPGTEPYGFFCYSELLYDGQPYAQANSAAPPPFPGPWTFFSWSPDGWIATADCSTGSNLWGWTRSFVARLSEGPR